MHRKVGTCVLCERRPAQHGSMPTHMTLFGRLQYSFCRCACFAARRMLEPFSPTPWQSVSGASSSTWEHPADQIYRNLIDLIRKAVWLCGNRICGAASVQSKAASTQPRFLRMPVNVECCSCCRVDATRRREIHAHDTLSIVPSVRPSASPSQARVEVMPRRQEMVPGLKAAAV